MPIIIQLSGTSLIETIKHYICTAGDNPVGAAIRALNSHIYERFNSALADHLINPLKVRPEPGPESDGPATLPALSKSGCEYWYIEVNFVTPLKTDIDQIQVVGDDLLQVMPIDYGYGIQRAIQLRTVKKKQQANHVIRINHLRVSGAIFQTVLTSLIDTSRIQPLLANFMPGPDIDGFHLVTYDHMLTGVRSFCSCAMAFHQDMLVKAQDLAPSYVDGSWPQQIIRLLIAPIYLEGICHLCLAKTNSPEEISRSYGFGIEKGFESFIDQVQFDIGMDRKTARAEIQQVLGLSRWVREAELFALVRNLFKDQLIQREASPDWLGRMRLDIYLPDLKLAIEHQGEQHYHPVAVFGGEEAFVRVVERDALKRQLGSLQNSEFKVR
jgi:hypothetical protein